MDFLRRLFGGGGAASSGSGERGVMFFYVRARGCEEVVQVRVNLNNDLSQNDEESGFLVRKVAMGTKCLRSVEIVATFNAAKAFMSAEVTGGEQVTAAEYAVWQASQG